MKNRRDKVPPPIVRRTARGLHPVSGFDAERVMGDALNTEYDLVKRTKRSWPQLKLYWSMVTHVQRATGCAPSPEHLSDEIKLTLGYRRLLSDLRTGVITESVDSIALDKMDHDAFMQFFEASQQLLAEKFGYDPLSFLEAA